MKKSIIISALLLFGSFAYAFDHQHTEFKKVLNKFVEVNGASSTVNYKSLKNNPKALYTYLSHLSSIKKETFNSWDKQKQLAFLINAYNAFTIKLIIDHLPVKSIKDIGGIFGNPWKDRFFTLLEKKMHLDEIEHEIIRKDYKEPRIHFALVCASIGCPKLQPAPYTAKELEVQLRNATKEFLNDSTRNKYVKEDKTLKVSSIFKWYGQDFGSEMDLKIFILKHMDKNLTQSELKKVQIEYLDYDWDLNAPKKD